MGSTWLSPSMRMVMNTYRPYAGRARGRCDLGHTEGGVSGAGGGLAGREHDDREQHEADGDDEGADDADRIEERVAPLRTHDADGFDDHADQRHHIVNLDEAAGGSGDGAVVE